MDQSSSRRPAQDYRPPKISVLIPSYNYARFLPQTIESVLAQDHESFEILISDDASSDGSAEIIRHYADRCPKIRFHLHTTNQGMVANWNWCLSHAHGEYVKFCFGDDLLATTDALSRYAAMLDDNPGAALAGSSRLLIDDNSQITGLWDDHPTGVHDGPECIARCLSSRKNLIGEPTSVMFRRARAARGFDMTLCQIVDLEMWFHLLLSGQLVYTSKPLCCFRRHSAQQTAINKQARVGERELLALMDRYIDHPALQRIFRPDSFAHRQMLFRHSYYAQKASRALVARRLPAHWFWICWSLHKISRPYKNLRRKLRIWTHAIMTAAMRPPTIQPRNRSQMQATRSGGRILVN